MTATQDKSSGGAGVLAIYTGAVFLSALLLFGVQPMFTRMVLPQLGGSPAVWSVAMVFFQTMLLLGYAYAHWLTQARSRVLAVLVHMALLLVAAFGLPLSIAQGWGEPPGSGTEFWLLGLFTVSIGLPFFALSANNPLLQAWFVRTGHRDGRDPYFLYAASNAGSFLALLSYPLLFEPVFTLQSQGRIWSAGFGLLVVLIGVCAFLLLRAPQNAEAEHAPITPAARPSWLTIGRWIFVAAVPSGMLVAVTAHISTDVTSAPLLWVMPLSLYLLTWVLVFQRRPLFSHNVILLLQPFALAWIAVLLYLGTRIPLLPSLAGHLLAFFVVAMACHGELARNRPPAAHLTSFYLSLSFGGMVGGLFAGLVAPNVFSWVAEYPILVVLAALCRPIGGGRFGRYEPWFWAAAAALAFAVIAPAFLGLKLSYAQISYLDFSVLTLAALSVVLLRDPRKAALTVALALIITPLYPTDEGRSEMLRSFFGVNHIYETPDRQFRVLKHGSTIHGAQRLLNEDGTPSTERPKPLTYYHDTSAMAVAIDAVRARKRGPIKVAAIGLGAGSLACRVEPGDQWRFFEIDPLVIEIARDPRRFSFVSRCAPDVPIVLGDARLTLAKEPDGSFDLIIIDAYSSDAIPVHLATREAMAIYKAKLAPLGVVAMHISNRHLELSTVVTGIAAANGMQTWLWRNDDDAYDDANYIYQSDVAISAESPAAIGALAEAKTWALTPPDPKVRTWTDDYSNIAGAFLRRSWP